MWPDNETTQDLLGFQTHADLIRRLVTDSANLPQSWVDAVGGGNADEAKAIQSGWMHKLGNLTLTAYNSTLSNDSVMDKRNRKDSQDNWVGYRNGIYLNAGISDKETWAVWDIQECTQRLVRETMELFKL